MARKRNTVAKVGKHVVSFGDSRPRRLASSKPYQIAGEGPSTRGPLALECLLTVQETANVLRCSKSSLDKWRLIGGGPRFVRVGARVRYRPADVAAYIAEQTRASTSAEVSPAA